MRIFDYHFAGTTHITIMSFVVRFTMLVEWLILYYVYETHNSNVDNNVTAYHQNFYHSATMRPSRSIQSNSYYCDNRSMYTG